MAKNEEKGEVEKVERPVNFQKIYATNFAGTWTEYDYRLELFNEKMQFVEEGTDKEEWVYLSDGMIILPPKAVERLKKKTLAYQDKFS
jgi:hypothetical protein